MLSNELDSIIESIFATCVTLPGNHSEVEYLIIAQHLADIDSDILKEIHDLPHPEDHDDYNDQNFGDW